MVQVKTSSTCVKCLHTAVSGANGKIVQAWAIRKQQAVEHAHRLHLDIYGRCSGVGLVSEVHCCCSQARNSSADRRISSCSADRFIAALPKQTLPSS